MFRIGRHWYLGDWRFIETIFSAYVEAEDSFNNLRESSRGDLYISTRSLALILIFIYCEYVTSSHLSWRFMPSLLRVLWGLELWLRYTNVSSRPSLVEKASGSSKDVQASAPSIRKRTNQKPIVLLGLNPSNDGVADQIACWHGASTTLCCFSVRGYQWRIA